MFPQSKIFSVKLPPLGLESVDVRWPTDKEWCTRTRALKITQTSLGRGKFRTNAENAQKVNADLFAAIRSGEGDLDEAEASYVIDQLERCNVETADIDGQCFNVKLTVQGKFETAHRLKAPRQKLIVEYRRSLLDETFGRGRSEIRSKLEPAGELYDAIHESHDGYEGEVPIIHKQAVVDAVIEKIQAIMDDSPEE